MSAPIPKAVILALANPGVCSSWTGVGAVLLGGGLASGAPRGRRAGMRGSSGASTTTRAGFARQGAKEKQLLKEGNAFNVSSFVLRAMMSGQYWPEGDEVYHAELTVPVLLVHGMHDKFVPVEEDQRMAEVEEGTRGATATNPQGAAQEGRGLCGGRGSVWRACFLPEGAWSPGGHGV